MAPLVSILIVAYNSGQYIKKTIESVIEQTYKNVEIIISDDCSTDNTWDIIQEFNDSRIFASRNEENFGEYRNRNKCINLANGKYLIFIDGDDTISKNGLSIAIEQMERFSDAGIGIARPANEQFERPSLLTPLEMYRMHYFGKSLFGYSFVRNIFNTEILKKAGGLPEIYKSGDVFIRLKIALNHNCIVISDGLGFWTSRKGQATERLKYSVEGITEPFLMDFYFLQIQTVFSSKEKRKALFLLVKKMILHSITLLKKFRFKHSLILQKKLIIYLYRYIWKSVV